MNDLADRFRTRLLGSPRTPPLGTRVLVGVSGGADSVVLLHLLRFTPGLPPLDLLAVHVDHGWRRESGNDARWLKGLCRAWGVGLRVERLPRPPVDQRSETRARELRHRILESARLGLRADRVALAHHADDQAETVLHRVARGTGPAGLAAMREWREPGIWRPLLGFWRAELRSYAADVGLTWRTDPSNRDPTRPRNVIRHRVIPALEEGVSSTARRSLTRLAELAAEEAEAWESALACVESGLDLCRRPPPRRSVSLAAAPFERLPQELRAVMLRRLAAELGFPLDRTGTEIAARFSIARGHGREVSLTGGLRLWRGHERLIMLPPRRKPTAEAPRSDQGIHG